MRRQANRLVLSLTTGTLSFLMAAAAPAAGLPDTVTGTASPGLVQLATTGNPEGLRGELGGRIAASSVIALTVGQSILDGLLDTAREEHLAPKALIAPTGEIYAMVAPTITKDHFILVTMDGKARRMDVGASEGTHRPFQVTEIVGDGGTPWYTELYYWLSGR